jgi:hypothetical protein
LGCQLIKVRWRVVDEALPKWMVGMDSRLRDSRLVVLDLNAALMFLVGEMPGWIVVRVLAINVRGG